MTLTDEDRALIERVLGCIPKTLNHHELAALLSAARDEGRAEGLGGECAYLAEWLVGWPAFDDSAPDTWTKDSAKAIRFARREDAEQVIQALGWTEARATEHRWGS